MNFLVIQFISRRLVGKKFSLKYTPLIFTLLSLFGAITFNCSLLHASDSFLANWMGQLQPVIGEQTLLDLSLPGTHDSLTYNLSSIVSDGGDDSSEFLSQFLHFESEIGLTFGNWIRTQAKTQILDVAGQLNQGIRFIDFRNMYSSTLFTPKDWYSLHFVQSTQKTTEFLKEIRLWLDAHPTEVVVLWISKHGDTCATGNDQYPLVSKSVKQKHWANIQSIFGGLLLDTVQSPLNKTSLSTLIQRNQRVVIYASDYVEFTGKSRFAIDGCQIDNQLPTNIYSEQDGYSEIMKTFANAQNTLQQDKAQNKFFLVSLAGSGSTAYLENAYFLKNVPLPLKITREKCAACFNIPQMTDWCPDSLLDVGYLINYYNQINLDLAVKCNLGFPNAIYIDAVAEGGTILTGVNPNPNETVTEGKFAYADSLLWMNVQRACEKISNPDCAKQLSFLENRRAKYPVQLLEDGAHGRHNNWPVPTPACP